MPKFYFHLYDDIATTDYEGRYFPDLEAARANALREARHLIGQAILQGRIILHHRIDVADEQGAVVLQMPFSEAVEIFTKSAETRSPS